MKCKFHIFLFILGLIAGLSSVAQQTKTLKGIVLETDAKGNINPIQGALVSWLNSNTGTTTDSAGVFYLPVIESGEKILIRYTGFKPDTITVQKRNFVKVMLVNKSELSDVTVTYERKATEVSYLDPWKTTIMNEKELFKSACCNLSESFETNPSVDVNFSDALTGTRQIQMLGLASQYAQVTQEMIPSVRGIATNYGFTYTPGTWLNSIQVGKGVGSVVNGFESIAGHINTELHKEDVKEKIYFNAYASEGGRYEANLNLAQKVTPSFKHMLMLHGSTLQLRMDNNNDGYLDNPLGHQWNILYRFKWDKGKGFMMQGGIRTLADKKTGGQLNFEEGSDTLKTGKQYGTQIEATRTDGWLKTGYVFPKKKYKSIGLQLSGADQKYNSFFGNNTYNGHQQSAHANLIYQSIIFSSDHRFRTGFSSQFDRYDEHLFNYTHYSFMRDELVNGAFFEYTYTYMAKFTAVAGLRADHHNMFGVFFTPRLHLRYAFNEKAVLRASAGRGQRTANLIAENSGLLVSSRRFVFPTNLYDGAFGFRPEAAWNYGLSFTQDFKLNYRKGTFGIDFYHTRFESQVIVDRDISPQEVRFYSLNGSSFSNSVQLQLDYEPIRRFDVRLAYRWYDVQAQFAGGMRELPMIAMHRAFSNFAYQTKNRWSFDLTLQWIGEKRLPDTYANPDVHRLRNYSPSYFIANAQISKSFFNKKLEMYAGLENLFDFKQQDPIIDPANPFGTYFDAGMMWGPVFGRMWYTGLRFRF